MFDYPVAALTQILFVPFALLLYSRMDATRATISVVLIGMLFLPEITIWELGGVVEVTKDRIAYLCALLGLALFHSKEFASASPAKTFVLILLPFLIVNMLGWQTNRDSMLSQSQLHAGLSFAWFIGQTIDDFFKYILPFVVGKALLRSETDVAQLMRTIAGIGMVYTVFIFVELIMAIPFRVFQFSYYIYDYPGRIQFRYGLTEPIVFFGRGHALSTFMLMCVISAAAFHKYRPDATWWLGISRARLVNAFGLIGTLKLASNISGIAAMFALSRLKQKTVARLATWLAIFVLCYPALQLIDVIPEDALIETVQDYDSERARSFRGRFEEEDFVFGVLQQKVLFGAGHFGRIPGADSFGRGEQGLDSWWIIRLGESGMAGVLVVLILLATPVLRTMRVIKRKELGIEAWLLIGLMLCIAVRMLDLLLNGWWNSFPMFFAGGLSGFITANYARRKRRRLRSFETG